MKAFKTKIETKFYVNGEFDEMHTTEAMEEKEALKYIKKWGKEDNVIDKGNGWVIQQITNSIVCTSCVKYEIVEE